MKRQDLPPSIFPKAGPTAIHSRVRAHKNTHLAGSEPLGGVCFEEVEQQVARQLIKPHHPARSGANGGGGSERWRRCTQGGDNWGCLGQQGEAGRAAKCCCGSGLRAALCVDECKWVEGEAEREVRRHAAGRRTVWQPSREPCW